MRLVRFSGGDRVHVGVVAGDNAGIVDVTALLPQFATMNAVIAAGRVGLDAIAAAVAGQAPTLALADAHLLAPVERPGKYLAIGMNYGKHLEEADKLGVARSKYQTWFNKQTTCISGPYDDIDHWRHREAGLRMRAGTRHRHGGEARQAAADALAHVFGYFVANDVSARDWQFHTPTFTMGKSFDTHGPIGPWIVTADEVPDPHALALRCLVNGELRQQSSTTANMINRIDAQIEYLSTAFTLEPGDLIATGTPEGVGVGMDPPVFLQRRRRRPLRDRRHRRDREPGEGVRRWRSTGSCPYALEVPDVAVGRHLLQRRRPRRRCRGADRRAAALRRSGPRLDRPARRRGAPSGSTTSRCASIRLDGMADERRPRRWGRRRCAPAGFRRRRAVADRSARHADPPG